MASESTSAGSKSDAEKAETIIEKAKQVEELLGGIDLLSAIDALEIARRLLLMRYMERHRAQRLSKPEP